MNKAIFYFVTGIIILSNSFSFGQLYPFFDDFESYTAGQQLACQNPIDWLSVPCDSLFDPYVTTVQAYSGVNSVVIVQYNDLVKFFGDQTSGSWHISFDVFIPTDKAGYFSILDIYPLNPEWAMRVYFEDGGNGILDVENTVQFTFPYDSWFTVEAVVDLDLDSGELRVNNNTIWVWNWSLGGSLALQLAAIDFFGLYPNNEMYIDNFWFGDNPVSVESETVKPQTFNLTQNYPNPFNPVTSIQYVVGSLQFVTLNVYDILGNEVATLVNEEKPAGTYEVDFDGSNLSSGIYFYQMNAGSIVETKNMVLLR